MVAHGRGTRGVAPNGQGVIASRLGKLRIALLKHTDRRVKLVNEALQGIRCARPHDVGTPFRAGPGCFERV